ncbi:hypothetical protein NKH77_47910 [Streptomyces sp. M19]
MIDPRRSTSAVRADHWLRVRPGTDAALALGIARLLLERGERDGHDELADRDDRDASGEGGADGRAPTGADTTAASYGPGRTGRCSSGRTRAGSCGPRRSTRTSPATWSGTPGTARGARTTPGTPPSGPSTSRWAAPTRWSPATARCAACPPSSATAPRASPGPWRAPPPPPGSNRRSSRTSPTSWRGPGRSRTTPGPAWASRRTRRRPSGPSPRCTR